MSNTLPPPRRPSLTTFLDIEKTPKMRPTKSNPMFPCPVPKHLQNATNMVLDQHQMISHQGIAQNRPITAMTTATSTCASSTDDLIIAEIIQLANKTHAFRTSRLTNSSQMTNSNSRLSNKSFVKSISELDQDQNLEQDQSTIEELSPNPAYDPKRQSIYTDNLTNVTEMSSKKSKSISHFTTTGDSKSTTKVTKSKNQIKIESKSSYEANIALASSYFDQQERNQNEQRIWPPEDKIKTITCHQNKHQHQTNSQSTSNFYGYQTPVFPSKIANQRLSFMDCLINPNKSKKKFTKKSKNNCSYRWMVRQI